MSIEGSEASRGPARVEQLRQMTAEVLAQLDAAIAAAEMKPGDPLEPWMLAIRSHILFVSGSVEGTLLDLAEAKDAVQRVPQGLSPKAEAELAERVGRLSAMAVRVEASTIVRDSLKRFTLAAIGASVAALVLVGGAGYWAGSRGALVTLQLKPGEIAGVCANNTVQAAPDGNGRVCAAWVRLDQATLAGSGK